MSTTTEIEESSGRPTGKSIQSKENNSSQQDTKHAHQPGNHLESTESDQENKLPRDHQGPEDNHIVDEPEEIDDIQKNALLASIKQDNLHDLNKDPQQFFNELVVVFVKMANHYEVPVNEETLKRMYVDIEADGKECDIDYIMNQLQQMTTEGGVPVIEATLKSKIQKVKTMIDDFNNKLAATKAQSDSYQESYKEIEGKLDDLENDIKSKETYETDLSILETNLKDAITKSLVNGTLNQEPFNTFCQEIKETNDRLRQDTLSICNMYSNDLWVIQLKRKIYKCFDEPDNATFETISKEYSALFEKHFKCELNQDSTNLEDVTLACHHLAKYYAVLPEWSLAEEEQIDQSSKFKTVKLASKENDIKALQVEPTINSTKPVEPTSKPTKSFSSNNTTIGGKTKSGSMEAQPLPRRESSLNNLRPVSTFLPYGHNTSVVSFNSFDEQTAASGQNNQRHNVPDSPVNHIPQQLAKRKPTLDELRSRTKAEFNLNSKKQLEKSWKRHLDMKKDSCDCIMCCCLSQEPLYRYCQMQCPKLCYMQDIHKLAIEKKEKCVCANCKDEESYLSGLLAIHRGLVTISSIERSQQMHRISKLPALPPPPLSSSSQQQQLAYRPLPPPPPQHEGMNTTTSYESNQNHPFQHNRTQVEFPNKKLAPSIEHLDKQKGFLNKLKDNLLK